MDYEILRAFIDGVIIGVITTIIINKIIEEYRRNKMEKEFLELMKDLANLETHEIPIEKEEELWI